MGSGVAAEAAIDRPRMDFAGFAGSPSIDPDKGAESTALCRELDCVRHLVSADVLDAAQERADKIGTGADRVLIATGALDEETYLRALASSLGIAFEPLDGVARAQCPLADERLIEFAAAGLLPLESDDGLTVVVAPRGAAARRIIQLIDDNPAAAARFRLTSGERFTRFVMRTAGTALTARATDTLKSNWPLLSAASETRLGGIVALASIAIFPIAAYLFAPSTTMAAFEILLAIVFLAWLALRLTGALIRRRAPGHSDEPADDKLPVYTIISALYREAASVDGLLRAIERFDYPAEKLDVILAVEADDRDNRAAIAAHKTRLSVTVIPVPNGGPRTKPKALNVALPFARGTFTVVYDAEDRPEPHQLREALAAFRDGDDDLACVQARLVHRQHRRQLAGALLHRRICRPVRRVPARADGAAAPLAARRIVQSFLHRDTARGRRLGSLQRH